MIGFRVDANEKIATGHLMRCIAIAKACEKRGGKVLFFLAENKETERLDALGFSYEILGTDWRNMKGETEKLCPLLNAHSVDWLVVDSYQADQEYLAAMQKHVRVLYIDDYGKEQYDISAVLNYNPWADETGFAALYGRDSVKLLLGGGYIPLREEFADGKVMEREDAVLITTGGTDPHNAAGKFLLECLGREAWEDICFEVIVGNMNSHEEELRALAEQYPSVHLHKNISNMSDYMRRCRAAVSAGGTTLYELCACGIPTVCFSFADNQRVGTEMLGKQGVMEYVGDLRDDKGIYERMAKKILYLMRHQQEWNRYSLRMRELVDGKGAGRIAEYIMKTV